MKLLFITASRIGDAIISSGVLNEMIERHPGIEVTVAAAPLTLPLFEGVPNLKRLIPIVKKPHHRHWIDLWQECRQEQWDIILDIRGSLVTYFLKVGKRYVWKSPKAYDHRVVQLGRLIGKTPAPSPRLWLTQAHTQKAARLVPPDTQVLALSPAANWIGKQWPPASFANLLTQFLEKYSAKVAIFAAPEEKESIQVVIDAIPKKQRLDFVGQLSLLEIAACIQNCRVFIGNDSGLMHMSAAIGTPTLGLFGPTDNNMYGPYCPPETPINQVVRTPESREALMKIPGFTFDAPRSYMNNLKPKTVFQVLEEMWGKTYERCREN
ncbi:MAG: glycosyltransferase family 9 protein [Alphaproteobacteria bacterium]|nr:glycosyltransferase family 9 protein [Alphaproteobacteria bacterium]